MKKSIVMMLGMALLPMAALAAPDFNGSWVRDNAKSDRDSYPLYWLTRGGAESGGGQGGAEYVISVRQDATSMRVTDPQRPLRTYMLDGKPHTVPTDTGLAKAAVMAGLQGDTLVISTTQPYGGMPGNATLKVKEVWSLSRDAKTLTITTTRDVPAMMQTIKQVYNRK
jgi:hypothetical protein